MFKFILDGVSLRLNHPALWLMGNSHWLFRTLPFGIWCHIRTLGAQRHVPVLLVSFENIFL